MNAFISRFAVLSFAAVLCSCNIDKENIPNYNSKVFIAEQQKVEYRFDESEEPLSETKELCISIPSPVQHEITGTFAFDGNLTDRFNRAYGESAVTFASDQILIQRPDVAVTPGNTISEPVSITFNGLEKLSKDLVYVAPIVLKDVKGMDVLQSKSVVYYVFKGAALINVVADISQNYLPVNWKSNVSGMQAITVEALIRVNDFGLVGGLKPEAMSTLFGVEGSFLIRIGDASFPQNQLQLVAAGAKFPSGSKKLGLPTGRWVHVAVVWNGSTGDRIIYHDGKEMAHDTGASGTISLATNCFVGRSYNDERWLDGEISELRIWRTQRTAEELSANMYRVVPGSEGLVAYWKFNDGIGKTVKDWSGNGNDIVAAKDLQWVNVSLPEENL